MSLVTRTVFFLLGSSLSPAHEAKHQILIKVLIYHNKYCNLKCTLNKIEGSLKNSNLVVPHTFVESSAMSCMDLFSQPPGELLRVVKISKLSITFLEYLS